MRGWLRYVAPDDIAQILGKDGNDEFFANFKYAPSFD
jgi:hypothetical protein